MHPPKSGGRRACRETTRYGSRVNRLTHTPVLFEDTLCALDPHPGETALDCTAGLGGHAAELARRVGARGVMVIMDLDSGMLREAQARMEALPEPPRIVALQGNFAQAPRRLLEQGLHADVVLADLGFSSPQIDDPARGFSFMRDGPLDMRLDPTAPLSGADLLREASEGELVTILREFGEERHAGRIARKLVAEREREPITTTGRLAEIVQSVLGPRRPTDRIHPATRTFQAVRIAVNDELGSLNRLLEAIRRAATIGRVSDQSTGETPGPQQMWLAPEARVGVIAFHSLEDRPVKNCFRDLVSSGFAEFIARKPIVASEKECGMNPRARSARFRAIRLTPRRESQ